MKQLFLKSIWLLCSSAFVLSTVKAASILPEKQVVFNPIVTPAPKVTIPLLPPLVATEKTVLDAFNDFKKLDKRERKSRIKEAKAVLKEYKEQKKNGAEKTTDKTLLIVLAILIPPLAVYLHQGEINSKFWISLVLSLLFWLPGMIYALLVVTESI
jgi:uncharacterized membrane protein YqaE (UPF0057 family)